MDRHYVIKFRNRAVKFKPLVHAPEICERMRDQRVIYCIAIQVLLAERNIQPADAQVNQPFASQTPQSILKFHVTLAKLQVRIRGFMREQI